MAITYEEAVLLPGLAADDVLHAVPAVDEVGPARERYQLGEIVSAQIVDPATYGLTGELTPNSVTEVAVADPYLAHLELNHPGVGEAVRLHEAYADAYARDRRRDGAWARRPGTAYTDIAGEQQEKTQWGDPVSSYEFFRGPNGLNSPALDVWRTQYIPSAEALRYLSDPENITHITDNAGNIHPIDETARVWLTACTDAMAIRSRGSVMAQLVKEFVVEHPELREDMRWMSVACGTALPAMKAAVRAGLDPELVLLDIDKKAMQATKDLAPEVGFTGDITQIRKNIFDPEAMARLRDKLMEDGDKRPHLMDLMGIFEYTGDELGVDPSEFLRSNFDLLHPGGRLVFGQMRADRPVPDFTMGVVQWPYVSMRTPVELMSIIQKAGIPPEWVRMYMPEDSVYMVCTIDKPAE